MATHEYRGQRQQSPEASDGAALVQACTQGAQAALAGNGAVQQELMRFWSTRMNRNMETLRDICRCRDLAAVQKAQADWYQNTAQDYFEEYARLTGLAVDLWRRNARPLEDCLMPIQRPD